MKPRLTVAIRRGLQVVHGLAEADFEAAWDDTRWTAQEKKEIERALAWVAAHAYATSKTPMKEAA